MAHPLMPKATAVWLVENTALTFEQIAAFCGLHVLEVQAIADDEVAIGMQGLDPIAGGELTQDEIDRCAADPDARLEMAKPTIPQPKARTRGARYTPVAKRQDRPDAISWLLRNHPELTDAQISRLIGTTKPTINAIRERTHWNMPNIKPQNPVGLGLCSATDLEKMVTVARARAHTVHQSNARPIEGDAPEPASKAAAQEPPASVPPAAEPPGAAPPASTPPAAEPPVAAPPPPTTPAAVPESHVPATVPEEHSGVPATPDVLQEAEKVFGATPQDRGDEDAGDSTADEWDAATDTSPSDDKTEGSS